MDREKWFTHLNEKGRARMVDVGEKQDTHRIAIAEGEVIMKPETLALIRDRKMAKGDVLGIAQVAGIMAAKQTSQLIPLCHPLILTNVDMDFYFMEERNSILIRSIVMTTGKTGVEMEALHAVTVAALTIYDICKAVERGMEISHIHLVEKDGGQSGHYQGKSYLKIEHEGVQDNQEEAVNRENQQKGVVLAVCVGDSRKIPKKQVPSAIVIENVGLKGDIHAGIDHKQVSLLSLSSLEKKKEEGYELNYGDLFENIVFQGLEDLYQYPIGTIIKIGPEVILSITQIGKDHDVDIVVRKQKVRSIMPQEGIFTQVVRGGTIQVGDSIEVIA
ncbi:MAG: cyclic pyranopterin monophosphate synthase MoaC [Atribacterota bacterium]|nr:cyclic pyranopterin monophosphate synthase MoaC [Atribacterota bacterium]MDD4895741.1 cyclic pyranopterin monophosphate synthase MoaC [Atribacterota bacterium]MDD5636764.1 cyclic pyranopterin monophosphate synthase MoaC [Atribacterota bacterium]